MRTLLVIQGYLTAEERIRRHWPYYLKAGCDILGIEREAEHLNWPKEGLIGTKAIGRNGYVRTGDLNALLLDSLRYCLSMFNHYSSFCLIENDSIFTRALPPHPGGLVATLGGHRGDGDGFTGEHYYHTPWWPDVPTAVAMVEWGDRMRANNLNEHGFPDRFIGLMVDLYKPRVTHAHAFSVNTIDRPEYVAEARKAIQAGVYYVHGIKTKEQLTSVTEGLL